jgi:enoyl-[acyl-carrier-protein] reductase (NADH)
MLAQFGAHCILTSRWEPENGEEITQQFCAVGAREPLILQADVADKVATQELFSTLVNSVEPIDIFVSNVSGAAIIKDFEDYSLRGLKKSISYSAWPLYEYTKKIKETFNQYPRYVIGISSTGPDHYSYGYDYVAAAKAVMETLCRYMTYRLRHEDICINIVRSRAIRTQSLENTFGEELIQFAAKLVPNHYWIQPEEVAGTVVALCSGLLDSMKGQVITVDRGTCFFDNVMDIYTRREQLPLFNHN